MSRATLPEDLRRFILASVPSVPFVEALLVYRAAGGAPVASSEVARRLYLPQEAAVALIEDLAAARLVASDPTNARMHRYAPAEAELARLVDRLAEYYGRELIAVTNLIHARTGQRAHQFADAFRWKKDS